MIITREIARKVSDTIKCGLVKGLGRRRPGKFCIEAAVCYAVGEPHSDGPSCVGSAVRGFNIVLNDASWSSDKARTAGMIRLGVAQLGSDALDQNEVAARLIVGVIRRLIPELFKDLGLTLPYDPALVNGLEAAADAARKAAHAAQAVADVAGRTGMAARRHGRRR